MVLLHGITHDRATYLEIVRWLVERGSRVASVDLRGHGESGWADSYKASEYANDVANLIQAQQIAPAVIVGHSLGGVVGASLTADHPDLVRALFMEDPPLFQGDAKILQATDLLSRQSEFIEMMRGWQETGVTAVDLAEEMSAWPFRYPNETMLDFFGLEGVRRWARSILACDPEAFEAILSGELWIGYDPLAPLACAVTLLAADQRFDGVVFPEHADLFKAAVPQARVVTVTGAAHEIHVERSGLGKYLQELERLLDSL